MRREIKFDLIYKGETGFHHKKYFLETLMAGIKQICDIHEMMELVATRQYTGLKDNNGVEIYEGDIVHVWHEDYPEEKQVGKVWWFNCYYPAFDIYTPSERSATGFESYHDEYNSFSSPELCVEVIGNIHESPELLEVK